MVKHRVLSSLLLMMIMTTATGCAKKADTSKPLDQIKSEAQTMSVKDLQSYAQLYAKAIMNQKEQLSKVADQIKTLTPAEIIGTKAQDIKKQLSRIETQVGSLNERYQIYAEKFKEKGGDLATVKMG